MWNLNSILNNFLLNAHDSRTEFKIYLKRSRMISRSFWKMCVIPFLNILLKYHNGRTDKLLICNIFVDKANPYYLNVEFYLFIWFQMVFGEYESFNAALIFTSFTVVSEVRSMELSMLLQWWNAIWWIWKFECFPSMRKNRFVTFQYPTNMPITNSECRKITQLNIYIYFAIHANYVSVC